MKGKRSYAEVVKNGSNSVLTAANNVPIRQKNSVFTRISFPRVSAFDRLDFSSIDQYNKHTFRKTDRAPISQVGNAAKNTEEGLFNLNLELNLGNGSAMLATVEATLPFFFADLQVKLVVNLGRSKIN